MCVCVCVCVCVWTSACLFALVWQVSKGAVATMYGTSKMLPAEDMEGLLARYIDLLYKVKPAAASHGQ